MSRLMKFLADENGAVTVDFVILCAAAAGLAIAAATTVAGEVNASAQGIGTIVTASVNKASGN